MPLCALLKYLQVDFEQAGFIDSTPIAVCHNKRTNNHKVFDGFAMLGKK